MRVSVAISRLSFHKVFNAMRVIAAMSEATLGSGLRSGLAEGWTRAGWAGTNYGRYGNPTVSMFEERLRLRHHLVMPCNLPRATGAVRRLTRR